MLDFMRRNSNSWVMIFLFAIIIFVFAINFGPWAGNIKSGVPYAAIVNNQVITLTEFHVAYNNQLGRIKQFRPEYNDEQANKDGLKQLVVDQLISRELLTQLGQEKHLRVGPKLLAQEIKKRVFGEDEKFNREEYQRRVGYYQSSVGQFEEQVEKEIVAQQMADLLGTAIFVSENEIKEAYIDENTNISLEYVKINPKFFKNAQVVSAQDIASYKLKHVKEISEYYSANISSYLKEKEVQASHILVKLETSGPNSNKELRRKRAEELLARVKNGEDFSTVAANESDDVASKLKGGDLGYFTSAMMVDEFSNAAFALQVGEISNLVESPFGFHIIKVTGEKAEQKRTEEQASDEIAELLIKQDSQNNQARLLANQALKQLESGMALDKVQAQYASPTPNPDAPVAGETNIFNRKSSYVAQLGNIAELVSPAFALDLNNKTPKNILEVDGNFLAIRLKTKTDADMSKFAEQKDTLKSRLEFPRRRALVQNYLTELKTSAKISYNQDLINGTLNQQY